MKVFSVIYSSGDRTIDYGLFSSLESAQKAIDLSGYTRKGGTDDGHVDSYYRATNPPAFFATRDLIVSHVNIFALDVKP